jgi:hypothetical protein
VVWRGMVRHPALVLAADALSTVGVLVDKVASHWRIPNHNNEAVPDSGRLFLCVDGTLQSGPAAGSVGGVRLCVLAEVCAASPRHGLPLGCWVFVALAWAGIVKPATRPYLTTSAWRPWRRGTCWPLGTRWCCPWASGTCSLRCAPPPPPFPAPTTPLPSTPNPGTPAPQL